MSIRTYADDGQAPPPGVAGAGLVPEVHPSQRSGRGGPERAEPRGAGGLPPPSLFSPPHPAGLVPSAKTARVVPSTLAGLGNSVVSPTFADVAGAAAAFGPSP